MTSIQLHKVTINISNLLLFELCHPSIWNSALKNYTPIAFKCNTNGKLPSIIFSMLLLITFSLHSYSQVKDTQKSHAIVDVATGNIVGGSIDGKWVSWESILEKIPQRQIYTLYNPSECLGKAVGNLQTKTVLDEETVQCIEFENLPNKATDVDSVIIGINAGWNALPRHFSELNVNQQIYNNVTHQYLNSTGMLLNPLIINRIIRIDIDGDKVDEIIISASSIPDPASWPEKDDGYFSIVLLRKIVNRKVITIPIAKSFYHKNDEELSFFTIESLLDLNGDGKLEIILGWYLNTVGQGYSIYQVNNDRVAQVFSIGGGE